MNLKLASYNGQFNYGGLFDYFGAFSKKAQEKLRQSHGKGDEEFQEATGYKILREIKG